MLSDTVSSVERTMQVAGGTQVVSARLPGQDTLLCGGEAESGTQCLYP